MRGSAAMKKNIGLFTIFVVFIVLAAIIAGVIFFTTESKKEQKSNVNGGEVTAVESVHGFEYGNRSDLVLSMDKGLFSVGSPETVSFTVQCPEESETVRILDEDDRELATIENKGGTSVTGSLVIDESQPRFGSLHAVSGNLESPEIYFTVAPEITDIMAETLVDVCLDVCDHLAAEYQDGPYTNETLSAVQQFLNEDPDA